MAARVWRTMDWPRVSRWCLGGAIVMVVWLLVPVARCSYAAFRDTPVGEVNERPDFDTAPGQADKDRVVEGTSFFSKLGSATKVCYLRTPLLGQQPWKRNLLLAFGVASLLGWSIGKYLRWKKRTFVR